VYYEAVNVPSTVAGLSRMDILYRIDLSFFVPVRDPSNPLFSEFVHKGEIQIELLDSTGTTVARKIPKFEVPTASTETRQATSWHTGLVSFDVAPGEYTIAIAVEDLESERSVTDRTRRALAREFAADKPRASSVLLINPPQGVSGDSASLVPVNFGGGIRFGHSASLVLVVSNGDSTALEMADLMVTAGRKESGKDSLIVKADEVRMQVIPHATLAPLMSGVPSYRIEQTDRNSSVVILPFQAEKIPRGTHFLKLDFGGLTVTQPLSVLWPDIPRSLLNPAYAVDVLRFITTSEQLDSLNSGDEEERRNRFDDFWRSRDRTPETAFNEVMAEYYSRVDHAAASFGTLREPDGTWSDRGRIHVLYGTPTKVERNLDPAGFIEVWLYENARKKFIFLDETKTGNYVLTSTRPL
jgi:GWxTD domain-containing protein